MGQPTLSLSPETCSESAARSALSSGTQFILNVIGSCLPAELIKVRE
jgi:hypothetical protein